MIPLRHWNPHNLEISSKKNMFLLRILNVLNFLMNVDLDWVKLEIPWVYFLAQIIFKQLWSHRPANKAVSSKQQIWFSWIICEHTVARAPSTCKTETQKFSTFWKTTLDLSPSRAWTTPGDVLDWLATQVVCLMLACRTSQWIIKNLHWLGQNSYLKPDSLYVRYWEQTLQVEPHWCTQIHRPSLSTSRS